MQKRVRGVDGKQYKSCRGADRQWYNMGQCGVQCRVNIVKAHTGRCWIARPVVAPPPFLGANSSPLVPLPPPPHLPLLLPFLLPSCSLFSKQQSPVRMACMTMPYYSYCLCTFCCRRAWGSNFFPVTRLRLLYPACGSKGGLNLLLLIWLT